MTLRVHIEDLRLQAIIGINGNERATKQEVLIKLEFDYDAGAAIASDRIEHTVDYKTIKKQVIALVEGSSYFLLEKLAAAVLDLLLNAERVIWAKVRVDKPTALSSARTVGVTASGSRP